MNFLELAKAVRRESGISGDGPSNVSGQTGMYAKIVEYVRQAHNEIQLAEHQWRFDWARHTQPLTQGVDIYDPADWGLSVRQWRRDTLYVRPAGVTTQRHWLTFVDHASMVHLKTSDTQGVPAYWTERPDRKIEFYPAPQAGLELVAEYYRRPEVLTGNTDIPRMPEEYHMAIVWRAVMMCCAEIEDVARFQVAQRNFLELMMRMRATELEPMDAPEALA